MSIAPVLRLFAFPPCRRALCLTLALVLSPALNPARADLNRDQVAAARAATALLITSRGAASAFCISEAGLFVTCDHTLDYLTDSDLKIVMSPAEKDERTYPAQIVRRMKDVDLAILQVPLDRKVPVLQIGDDSTLFETEQLYGFGYPFPKPLPVDVKSYAPIGVSMGHITSLPRIKGVLEKIEFDARLLQGTVGGPVLDSDGKLVGIIVAWLSRGSDLASAIPVSRLRNGMKDPIITVSAPQADSEHRTKPVDFTVSVDWLVPSPPEPKVSLEIRSPQATRRVDASKGRDGKYRVQTIPAGDPGKAEQARLHVSVDFEGSSIAGLIPDRQVSIGGRARALGEFHTLQRVGDGSGFLADGKSAGNLPELKELVIDVGRSTVTVDARKATRIEIQKEVSDPTLFYRAVLTLPDGKEFATEEKAITMLSAAPLPPPVLSGVVDLPARRDIRLPAPVSDVVAAQDGRSLLLLFKDSKKLAVFDVIDLKIRGDIDLSDDDPLIAGGSRHILIAYSGSGVIERFSVDNLQKERAITTSSGKIPSITMGKSSPGLALVVSNTYPASNLTVRAFDAESMTFVATADRAISATFSNPEAIVRASADGRTFGVCRQMSSPTGFNVITIRGDKFNQFYRHETCGLLVPNADGTEIFTSQTGVLTNEDVPLVKHVSNPGDYLFFVPSYHPTYFLSVSYQLRSPIDQNFPTDLHVFVEGFTEPLFDVPGLFTEMAATTGQGSAISDRISLDKRYHFYPQLNELLLIPPANDRIVAVPLNVRRVLDEKKLEYLYVTSVPPVGKASSPYRYRLEAAASGGPVKFTLRSGPPGLTVTGDGQVDWKTPDHRADETVIVSLKDAGGREAFHTFHVVIAE